MVMRIFADHQNNFTADRFAFAIKVPVTPRRISGPTCTVATSRRRMGIPSLGDTQWNSADLHACQIPIRTIKFSLASSSTRTTGFLIGIADRVTQLLMGYPEC